MEQQRKKNRSRVNKRRKKGQFSKFWVSFSICSIIIFTIIVLFLFYRTGAEPSTLIKYFYSVFAVELGGLAGIKVTKNKYKNDDYNDFG